MAVPQPQVFINFRGDELRYNFVDRLVKALEKEGINVFIDVNEWKGRKLKYLLKRIKMSKIALAVFSERYCESNWCLDELVEMNEHMNEGTLLVIPIFYNVTANDVKRAGNLYREADFIGNEEEGEFTILFKKMKQRYATNPVMVKKWEFALKSVTERIGLSHEVYGDSLVKAIVKEVRKHLGMPPRKLLSNRDVAFAALWATSVFTFIVAPQLFPDVKIFKTGKWVLGFPLLVLAWHFWDRKYYNTPKDYISEMSHSSIWYSKRNRYRRVNEIESHRLCHSK